MKTAVRFAIVLGIVCLVMGSGVALVYATFKDAIAQKDAEQFQALLSAVLPEAATPPEPVAEGVEVYLVRDAEGQPLAYAASGSAPGYVGPVDMMVGVWARPGLPIHRVAVLRQMETPGLGSNVAETRSTYNLWQKLGQLIGLQPAEEERLYNVFLDQFDSAVVDPQTGAFDRRIDAITAATITSVAVEQAVQEAVSQIRRHAAINEAEQ
jgi:RnfABCDGE-type electron transport complex G subunit